MNFTKEGNNAWLFQKAYYKGFDWNRKEAEPYAPDFFGQRLQQLISTTLNMPPEPSANVQFGLYTVYPGLATGVGVKHESKSKGELKLGFEFDYSSGMPIIRGHSVKGALRAAFPQDNPRSAKAKYKKEKAYRLHCWIAGQPVDPEKFDAFKADESLYKRIVAIEEEIFDGRKESKLLSAYQQDVFFDAFISEASRHKATEHQYLGTDSITPHIKKDRSYESSMLTNPVPIPFLKVLPGVAFQFRFQLYDGILKAKEKEELFKKILLNNGIGAKTNVGYGQFSTTRTQITGNIIAGDTLITVRGQDNRNIPAKQPKPYPAADLNQGVMIEAVYKGKVVATNNHLFAINIIGYSNNEVKIGIPGKEKIPVAGDLCELKTNIVQKNNKGSITNVQFSFVKIL